MKYAMSDNLVQRCLDGEQDAFTLLVEKYKGYVFAIILSFVRDEETAKDIAQEVFLQVYRSLASYRQQNFKGWIGRITANKAIDYKRKKRLTLCEMETAEQILGRDDDGDDDNSGDLEHKVWISSWTAAAVFQLTSCNRSGGRVHWRLPPVARSKEG
jgi:RNA polymerase sigma factor (sigma-70 family)